MDKKIGIGIIFIILIISTGLVLIMTGDDPDEPEFVEDDELTKSDVSHNINEKIDSTNSYKLNTNMVFEPENSTANSIYIDSERIYSNDLSDAFIQTNIQEGQNEEKIQQYNFNNTAYIYDAEFSEWNVKQSYSQNQLFNYLDIINEDNIESYEFEETDTGYVFTTEDSHIEEKIISISNHILNEEELDNIQTDSRITSVNNATYEVIVDKDSYGIKEINIQSNSNLQNEMYNVTINFDMDLTTQTISIPSELNVNENIEYNTYYNFLEISRTTDNAVKIDIIKDISDEAKKLTIKTERTEQSLSMSEGTSITLEPDRHYNQNAPNIEIIAITNFDDKIVVGDYKISSTIEINEEDNEDS